MTTTLSAPARVHSSNRLARFAPMLDQVADPLGYEAGDPNLRRYVGNGPLSATDPSGLQPPKPADQIVDKPWIVIVTGFGKFPEAYDKDDDNPSNPLTSRFVYELQNREVYAECITPVKVDWGRIDKVIDSQSDIRKDFRIIWIAFGAGPDSFRIETQGDNKRLRAPDDSGNVPGRDGVPALNDPGRLASAKEMTQLTAAALREIQKSLKLKDIDLKISNDAGDYICESTAFKLHNADRTRKIDVGIFIHTPPKLTTEQQEAFAKALADALFENGVPVMGRLVPAAK